MSSHRLSEAQPWSIGAILAEEELEERVCLLVIRPDAGLTGALEVRRRLLAGRLAGYTTMVVQLVHGHLSDVVLAALMNGARGLELRRGRLVVEVRDPAVRSRLSSSGIELADQAGV